MLFRGFNHMDGTIHSDVSARVWIYLFSLLYTKTVIYVIERLRGSIYFYFIYNEKRDLNDRFNLRRLIMKKASILKLQTRHKFSTRQVYYN